MTKNLGNIVICGRLGKTPKLKYSKNKKIPMCFLDVAENREGEDEAKWHQVIVWGEQAEYCNHLLKTGVQFFVQGLKQRRKFTDKEGNEREAEEVKAKLVGFPKGP